MSRPRVLLADDHQMILHALAELLGRSCDVVGLATNGHEAVVAAESLQPDIAVLDISMPQLNGFDAVHRLRQVAPDCRVIFLTVDESPATASEALRIGAQGYVVKSAAATELFEAIHAVRSGETWITPRIPAEQVAEAEGRGLGAGLKSLTSRQREVLQLLAEGRSMKQVGSILGITPRTVAFHKYRVMRMHGIDSTAGLVQLALREGLIAAE